PELVATAATDLADLGSWLGEVRAAVAASISSVLAAAALASLSTELIAARSVAAVETNSGVAMRYDMAIHPSSIRLGCLVALKTMRECVIQPHID
ncbi:PE domain-containing protein, partial [Mycobacterium kiyosense]|uniref:PE domain-containing protein n=1 Tax=Mycobacterium kiyosense TaxID=2871094 RepID=UPI00222E98D7